jgi:hypothetical protein
MQSEFCFAIFLNGLMRIAIKISSGHYLLCLATSLFFMLREAYVSRSLKMFRIFHREYKSWRLCFSAAVSVCGVCYGVLVSSWRIGRKMLTSSAWH